MDLRKQNGNKGWKKWLIFAARSCLRLSDFFFLQYSKRMMGLYIDIEIENIHRARVIEKQRRRERKKKLIIIIMEKVIV